MNNAENLEYWYSEYELRQFIDMATRYDIESIYQNVRKDRPFSLFEFYVKNARGNYDLFCSQLNKKLTETTNCKAIEVDLKDRFLPMIEQYQEWYNNNESQTKKFDPYNPYEVMLSIMKSTKHEILKYFPETPHQRKEKKIEYETLIEAFNEVSKYRDVIDKLVKNDYCLSDGTWKDQKKGWRTTVASLIKWLAVAGYCKKTTFSTVEIQAICNNTFKISDNDRMESTIKHAKVESRISKLFPKI
jgi:hypothetical protein